MIIVHTFSTQKYQNISTIDIALWHMSCLSFLAQGYKLRLYCSIDDIDFLEENKLLQYYSSLNTTAFENSELLKKVDENNFWFMRKLVALSTEMEIANEPVVYSDTDLFILKPIDVSNCDALFWCFEDRHHEMTDEDYYCDWKYFSLPEGYEMPEYIKNTTNSNYNTGLVYFKDKKLYQEYIQHVLDFSINNPCEFTNETLIEVFERTHQKISKVWAMNCEQRILTGLLKHKGAKVKVFDESELKFNGLSEVGGHYFVMRGIWNQVKYWPKEQLRIDYADVIFVMQNLIDFKNAFFRNLEDNELYDTLNFFKKKKQFKDLDKFELTLRSCVKDLLN